MQLWCWGFGEMKRYQKIMLAINIFMWLTLLPYLCLTFLLGISNPFFIVGSQSMAPTLNHGDLLIVQGCVNAYVGDIIIFTMPKRTADSANSLLAHRVVGADSINGTVYYKTKGDNNAYADYWVDYRRSDYTYDGMVSNRLLIGKVKYVIPNVGTIFIFIQTPSGTTLVIILIAILVIGEILSQARKGKPQKILGNTIKSYVSINFKGTAGAI
jgi:signal peptidase I